jgi:glycosyltransferase involved in cell wall biosynthesis
MKPYVLSVVVPVCNEAENIEPLYAGLQPVLQAACPDGYEIIFVDDGSTDTTQQKVGAIHSQNARVKLLSLSRNFGKEVALSSGIAHALGEAILTMDGDGQHPPDLIPDFLEKWRQGAQVVVGVRRANKNEGVVKKYGSKLFYMLFNNLSGAKLVPGSSDYRLIDSAVQREFVKLREPHSIARGLIDWLGFERAYISYNASERHAGVASYKFHKLIRLAAHSFVSLSPTPLYIFGYLGLGITIVSFVLGTTVLVEQILLGDPLSWDFTGTAMLSILVIFLVGMLLVAQGVLALYVSYIYTQSKDRPLYVVNNRDSLGMQVEA